MPNVTFLTAAIYIAVCLLLGVIIIYSWLEIYQDKKSIIKYLNTKKGRFISETELVQATKIYMPKDVRYIVQRFMSKEVECELGGIRAKNGYVTPEHYFRLK